jgi:hypothetical protein
MALRSPLPAGDGSSSDPLSPSDSASEPSGFADGLATGGSMASSEARRRRGGVEDGGAGVTNGELNRTCGDEEGALGMFRRAGEVSMPAMPGLERRSECLALVMLDNGLERRSECLGLVMLDKGLERRSECLGLVMLGASSLAGARLAKPTLLYRELGSTIVMSMLFIIVSSPMTSSLTRSTSSSPESLAASSSGWGGSGSACHLC